MLSFHEKKGQQKMEIENEILREHQRKKEATNELMRIVRLGEWCQNHDNIDAFKNNINNGANMFCKDEGNGMNLLHYAVQNNAIKIAEYIKSYYPALLKERDYIGNIFHRMGM